jgi:nucleoside-diphosphate-sugar epimerase
VVEQLCAAGYAVRNVARRIPAPSSRVAGVEYIAGDLARGLTPAAFDGVDTVVHCAAETAGGQAEQQRNSIGATRLIIEGAAAAGVKKVIHVSSLAVLKPGSGRTVDETTPVDAKIERGPYVWGKAESELLARELAGPLGIAVKVVRPGPLVDYSDFQAPGRLGRELGPWYVAVGGRRTPLSVLDVTTGARVIRSYVDDFAAAPAVVNLVESPAPTRGELIARLRAVRPDLRVIWFPSWLLWFLSMPARWAQRFLLGAATPIDLYAAFSSERYGTEIAGSVIRKASATDAPISARVA